MLVSMNLCSNIYLKKIDHTHDANTIGVDDNDDDNDYTTMLSNTPPLVHTSSHLMVPTAGTVLELFGSFPYQGRGFQQNS